MRPTQSRSRTNQRPMKRRACFFCINKDAAIDYKNVLMLRRYISSYGKITPRRKNGVCATHQRKLARAIKRARIMALLPFVIQ